MENIMEEESCELDLDLGHGHNRLLSTVPEEMADSDLELSESFTEMDFHQASSNPLLDIESQQPLQQQLAAENPDSATTATAQASSTNSSAQEDNADHRGPMVEKSESNVSGDISASGSDTLFGMEEDAEAEEFHPRMSSKKGLFRRKGSANTERESLRKEQGQHVSIRTADDRDAMDGTKRRRNRWKKRLDWLLRNSITGEDSDDDDDMMMDGGIGGTKISMHGRLMVQPSRRRLNIPRDNYSYDADEVENGKFFKPREIDEEEAAEKRREETQYRLTTVKGKNRATTIAGMYEDVTTGDAEACWTCCLCCPSDINSDRAMSAFLHWSFRSPFVMVFGTAAIGWLALTFVFAFGIYLIGLSAPECIGGVDFAASDKQFTDAYQLSWTTFSTVGYGLIYPATSAQYQPVRNCWLISVYMTFESFVGVLFSSLCAALMFAKIARAQSFAQVRFSDPMVIRYGNGVNPGGNDDDEDEEDGNSNQSGEKGVQGVGDFHIPCPVLEFRIFNKMDGIHGGEIIDATLNMVASIDASHSDHAHLTQGGRRRKGKKKRGAARPNMDALRQHRGLTGTGDELTSSTADDSDLSELSNYNDGNSTPESASAPLHQSVAARDAPLQSRGPAPSIARRRKTNPDNMEELAHQQQRRHPSLMTFGQQHQSSTRRTRFNHGGDVPSAHSGRHRHSLLERINSFSSFAYHRQKQDSNADNSLFNQQNLSQVTMRNTNTQAFDEDPSGKLMSRKILSKLELDSPDHPFFRRIWLVRHTLDMNSLLLKPHVRELVRRNHGFWPKELNNYESIRASIEFDQIIVSFSGTSNVDANSVYSQHVYSMVDVNVGYRFVNALYRDPTDGRLRVDQTLINDVMEQAGGGGEPFQDINEDNYPDLLVL